MTGMLYTAFFMVVRCFDKSYAVGGAFHAAIAAAKQPKFVAASGSVLGNSKVGSLAPMLATMNEST